MHPFLLQCDGICYFFSDQNILFSGLLVFATVFITITKENKMFAVNLNCGRGTFRHFIAFDLIKSDSLFFNNLLINSTDKCRFNPIVGVPFSHHSTFNMLSDILILLSLELFQLSTFLLCSSPHGWHRKRYFSFHLTR